jgi:hypothetical protein
MDSLTAAIVGLTSPRSISSRARLKRWTKFRAAFPDIVDMRVLDLGGRPQFWRSAPVRPLHVTTLNLERLTDPNEDSIDHRVGDACAPPDDLCSGFDLVVSNSLIEHLGGHAKRQQFADVVRTAADRHWVQTPYRYFPVEPHWVFPLLQFLPFAARVHLTRKWPLGNRHPETSDIAIDSVHEVELIGKMQMLSYFPDANLWFERLGGVPKSMVSIRR